MFRPNTMGKIVVAACLVWPVLVRTDFARGADSVDYGKIREKAAPAMVNVKCVLKVQGPGGSRETESEFTALMIDRKGLVLCSSMNLGLAGWMRRMGSVTPTDIKVLIGDDTEGVKAKLLAGDSELDLSWLQIEEPNEDGYDYVDFSKSRSASLGERIVGVKQLDKYFDRAVVVSEGRIGGRTSKPRELLVPSGGLETEVGMPVFAIDGSPIGVVVTQSPDSEDMDMRRRLFSGGTPAFILPVEELSKATKRAQAAAESEEEEEEEEEAQIEPKPKEKKEEKAEKEKSEE